MKGDLPKRGELLVCFSSIGLGLLLLNIFKYSWPGHKVQKALQKVADSTELEMSEEEHKGGTENMCSGKNVNMHGTKY